VANIPALAGPPVRTTSIMSVADGLKEGKDGMKPVLVLFLDSTPKSKQWTEALGDKMLDELFGKIVYAAVEFKKGGEAEKKYSISSAPSLLLLDPTKDEAKPKKLSSPAPASLKKEVDALVKAMAKK
jgi:hypothetical protein